MTYIIQRWQPGFGWKDLIGGVRYERKSQAQIALRHLPRGRYRIIAVR